MPAPYQLPNYTQETDAELDSLITNMACRAQLLPNGMRRELADTTEKFDAAFREREKRKALAGQAADWRYLLKVNYLNSFISDWPLQVAVEQFGLQVEREFWRASMQAVLAFKLLPGDAEQLARAERGVEVLLPFMNPRSFRVLTRPNMRYGHRITLRIAEDGAVQIDNTDGGSGTFPDVHAALDYVSKNLFWVEPVVVPAAKRKRRAAS